MNNEKKQTQIETATTAEDASNNGSSSSLSSSSSSSSSSSTSASSPIIFPPQPRGRRPIVGHLPLLNKIMKQSGNAEVIPAITTAFKLCAGENSIKHDIVHIQMVGTTVYLTSNADYAGIVTTDLEHWGKITHTATRGVFYAARKVIGNALFTASDGDDWAKSHRILMPAFSPKSLSSLVDITLTKTDCLLDRIGSSSQQQPFEIGQAFTGLTFDIIGNFIGGPGLDFQTTEYPDRMSTEPFLCALETALNSTHIEDRFDDGRFTHRKLYKKRQEAKHTLWERGMEVINDRLDGKTMSIGGPNNPDVLDCMLNTIDKGTNEKMDIELVRNNLILFLLVGHDSTSSLLTSLMFLLSQHPEVEEKMRNEVDQVMGEEPPDMQNIKNLPYTMAVIKETLRLYPPAQAILKTCMKDTTLGPYTMTEGCKVLLLPRELHRNKTLWGDNADEFDPSRFMLNSLNAPSHEHAWMPFSSGPRGCIGMQFSLIEARVILARIMQRRITFRLHKDAEVGEKFRTFMKLSNVMMTSHESNGSEVFSPVPSPVKATPEHISSSSTTSFSFSSASTTSFSSVLNIEPHDGKVSVYFGSNMGTCEDISSALCDEAIRMGFDTSLDPLDAASSKGLGRECINLIVTSTYNGQPPDNAKKFAEYLKTLQPGSLSGVKVAICGVGNSNWKSFQSFPCSIVNALESAGADIICPRGIADEEKDLKNDVGAWRQFEFWPSAFEAIGLDPAQISSDSDCISDVPELNLTDTFEQATVIPRSGDTKLATVISARELQCSTSDRSTRHIELKLPNGMNYREGDHIAVFPENNCELVLQIASLLNEHDLGRTVKVSSTNISNGSQPQQSRGMGHLPFDVPVRVSDLLSRHVDLQAPASAAFVSLAAESTSCLKDREALEEISKLIRNGVAGNLQELRPAQVLLAFPSTRMSLGKFLATVAPMKKRYYSISSSPTVSQNSGGLNVATVTVALVKGIEKTVESSAFTYLDSKEYRGVSSGFLQEIRPGQLVEISIGTNDRFRLPENPSTPVIMIGPGTGIAPFRGFYQAIEAEEKETRRRRPAMLFFGCRNEQDYLYRSELESAPIELHVAFSRPTTPNTKKKYVQDLLWSNRDRVWKYLKEEKAYIYICGDGRYMAKDVDNILHRIARECGNMSESDAIAFYDALQGNNRYLQDVWC